MNEKIEITPEQKIKIEAFAVAMSDLLYEIRSESEIIDCLETPNTGTSVPETFIDATLDNEEHVKKIKEEIRLDVVHHLTQSPDDFKNDKGEYEYQTDIYDYSAQLDAYVERLYEDTNETKSVWVCPECGSDNVQAKMWVNVNTNNVCGEAMEDDDEYYCEDCKNHIGKVSEEIMMPRKKVIGFQVTLVDGVGHSNLHPMIKDKSNVYNRGQVEEMLFNFEGLEYTELKTIWTTDIECPVMMFEGNVRD